MKALIKLDVPEYQIGQTVYAFFKDTMMLNGVCEAEQKPVKPDIEGGGSSWFYVCGECHGSVNSYDKYCRHCGTKIAW